MRAPDYKKYLQIWDINSQDYNGDGFSAKEDWRYFMFFKYLRFSPSYGLALECTEQELIERLGNKQRAKAVWKTRCDMGNVFDKTIKDWWLERGLKLFGVNNERPNVELLHQLLPSDAIDITKHFCHKKLDDFLAEKYVNQGCPESLLVSIPLTEKNETIIGSIDALLSRINPIKPQMKNQAIYKVERNKLQFGNLLIGSRLMINHAMNPEEKLWQIAARAKISQSHRSLDPNATRNTPEIMAARRVLTVMACRLQRKTLTIAENAAMGKFPSLDPIETYPFSPMLLHDRFQSVFKIERECLNRMSRQMVETDCQDLPIPQSIDG